MDLRLHKIKVVVVGDAATGKTSLLMALNGSQISDVYTPGVLSEYEQTLDCAGISITLTIVDTRGSEDYDRSRPLLYDNADCFLLVFSVIQPNSLTNMRNRWLPEVRHFAGLERHPKHILIGNKVDLRNDPGILARLNDKGYGPVSYEDGMKYSNEELFTDHFIETSALTGQGLSDFWNIIVTVCSQKKRQGKNCVLL
eukprot:TRINITY_DN11528_c0_g1_i1.p1 TRINITY_DN11528_c0_g1~~TRINITY_DN11528_c0_g1_i1.p1  ORF type:complete len:198 (+),score=-5.72 TRINITY_DN11528_c0_g1_i1:1-594(+)